MLLYHSIIMRKFEWQKLCTLKDGGETLETRTLEHSNTQNVTHLHTSHTHTLTHSHTAAFSGEKNEKLLTEELFRTNSI